MRISDHRKNPEWCTRYLHFNLDDFFPDETRPRDMPRKYVSHFTISPVLVPEDGIHTVRWGVLVWGAILGYVDEDRTYVFRYATSGTRLVTDAELATIEGVKK